MVNQTAVQRTGLDIFPAPMMHTYSDASMQHSTGWGAAIDTCSSTKWFGCTSIYKHTHILTHMCIHIHIHMHMHMHNTKCKKYKIHNTLCVNIYIYYVHIHVTYTYTCTYTYIHIHIHVYIYIDIYIHIHIHIHMLQSTYYIVQKKHNTWDITHSTSTQYKIHNT